MSQLCVRSDTCFAKVTLRAVPDRPGIAAELFGRLGAEGFNIELLVSTGGGQGQADISFMIKKDELPAVLRMLDRLKGELGAQKVEHQVGLALIGVAGQDLNKKPGIAGRMFRALSRQGINIDVISTSLSSVTCAIDERMVQEAQTAVRQEFAADI
jgi:aspartate kinase